MGPFWKKRFQKTRKSSVWIHLFWTFLTKIMKIDKIVDFVLFFSEISWFSGVFRVPPFFILEKWGFFDPFFSDFWVILGHFYWFGNFQGVFMFLSICSHQIYNFFIKLEQNCSKIVKKTCFFRVFHVFLTFFFGFFRFFSDRKKVISSIFPTSRDFLKIGVKLGSGFFIDFWVIFDYAFRLLFGPIFMKKRVFLGSFWGSFVKNDPLFWNVVYGPWEQKRGIFSSFFWFWKKWRIFFIYRFSTTFGHFWHFRVPQFFEKMPFFGTHFPKNGPIFRDFCLSWAWNIF